MLISVYVKLTSEYAKEKVIFGDVLQDKLRRELETIPGFTGALPVIRHLDGGEELWLFVTLQTLQLEHVLETRIIAMLRSVVGVSSIQCRVYPLSAMPVTRSGRLMRSAVERFVNHMAVPNRLQMRNPEVLDEIVQVIRTHNSDAQNA